MIKVKLKIPFLVINGMLMLVLALNNVSLAFAGGGCNENDTRCTTIATLDVGDGPLSLTTSNLAQFNYALGDATRPTGTLPITVNDTRGTGAGWTVTLTMTQFTGENSSSHTLSKTGTASVTAIGLTCAQETTCTLPESSGCSISSSALPITMDGTTSTQLCNSEANAGMGEIVLNPTITLAIPGYAFVDTYTSAITVTVTSDV